MDEAKQPNLYFSFWKRSKAWRDDTFAEDEAPQPHPQRREEILKTYPLIRMLYGPDIWTAGVIVMACSIQLLLAHIFSTQSISLLLIVTAYVIGGTMVGLLTTSLHDCIHSLISHSMPLNNALAFLCNLPIPLPIAMSFARYHIQHHVHQGSKDMDPDMPLDWEIPLIRGVMWKKLLWLLVYPFMYALRALARSGGRMDRREIANYAVTIVSNVLLYKWIGSTGMFYLGLSFYFGHTIHPVAAHFIQEHYTFVNGQETYNYYGWANLIFLNVGFHYEHHDFSSIPARRLPLATLVAREYYLPLKAHMSWRRVLFDFLTDDNMGPVSRCIRAPKHSQRVE